MAGCSFAPSIGDGSAVAADDVTSSDRATDSASATPAASTPSTMPPATLSLPELLLEDRFVPLAIALEQSGLDTVIGELDEFVLVAPVRTAFAASGTDVGVDYFGLLNRPQLLEAILRYHVVADPSTNTSWRTLNGASLDVNGPDPATIERVDGVEVLDRIRVRNGVVLVVPRVLVPARQPAGSVATSQPGG